MLFNSNSSYILLFLSVYKISKLIVSFIIFQFISLCYEINISNGSYVWSIRNTFHEPIFMLAPMYFILKAITKMYYKNSFGMKEMISPICHVVNGCKSNETNFKKFATVTKQSLYCKYKKDFKWSCHDFHRRSYFGSFKNENLTIRP